MLGGSAQFGTPRSGPGMCHGHRRRKVDRREQSSCVPAINSQSRNTAAVRIQSSVSMRLSRSTLITLSSAAPERRPHQEPMLVCFWAPDSGRASLAWSNGFDSLPTQNLRVLEHPRMHTTTSSTVPIRPAASHSSTHRQANLSRVLPEAHQVLHDMERRLQFQESAELQTSIRARLAFGENCGILQFKRHKSTLHQRAGRRSVHVSAKRNLVEREAALQVARAERTHSVDDDSAQQKHRPHQFRPAQRDTRSAGDRYLSWQS